MKKEELRPVECRDTFFRMPVDGKPGGTQTKTIKGWFHDWKKTVDENGSQTIYALVEDEEGKMWTFEPDKIKFLDRQPVTA